MYPLPVNCYGGVFYVSILDTSIKMIPDIAVRFSFCNDSCVAIIYIHFNNF